MRPIDAHKILLNLADREGFAELSPHEVIVEFAETAGLSTDGARELIKGLAANVKTHRTPEQARRYVAAISELSETLAMLTGTARLTFERTYEMVREQYRATAGSDPFCRDRDMLTGLLADVMKLQPLTACRH